MATKKDQPTPLKVLLPYFVAAALGGFLVWVAMRSGVGATHPEPIAAASPAGRLDPVRTRPDQFDWTRQPDPTFPLPPYARFLKDVSIVVDPGHIGQSERNRAEGWKRGPTGLREAEANFRVALFLREFLEAAGAKATLTRDRDVPRDISDEEDLADRAAIANRIQADVLVSIHHNAAEKPDPNYTAVFYHFDGSASPASLDVGRNLLTGINDALRLEKHGDCGLWSDLTMYPNGFGLLRRLEVPGVLCESSFHTNPEEERRLRDPVYNRREAYGMFVGLARWAQAGLPRVELVEPENGRVRPGQTITLRLDDGLSRRDGKGVRASKMRNDSLVVEFDGRRLAYIVNAAKGIAQVTFPDDVASPMSTSSPDASVAATLATFPPPGPSPKKNAKSSRDPKSTKPKSPPKAAPPRTSGTGAPRLFVDFENVFGQHVLHPWMPLLVE